MASTASFLWWSLTILRPNFSIKVLLPAPGAPQIPIRKALLRRSGVRVSSSFMIRSASWRCCYLVDSISVTVLLSALLWPFNMFSTRSLTYALVIADRLGTSNKRFDEAKPVNFYSSLLCIFLK